jgi:membrane protease YdiL (CAAX protease family)
MTPRRPWQSLWEVVLCSGYPTQLALGGTARLAGLAPQSADGTLSLTFVAVVSGADTVVLVGLILWLLHRRGESPGQVFLDRRRQGVEAGLGVLLAPAVLFIIWFTLWLLHAVAPSLRTVPSNPFESLAASREGAFVVLLLAIVAGGVREEIQRAFLLHRFRVDLGGAGWGLLATSLAFGLGHGVQGWDAVVVTTLLGALWGALYLARASVTAGMVSHALANAAQVMIAHLR